jgi:hypothetical protein
MTTLNDLVKVLCAIEMDNSISQTVPDSIKGPEGEYYDSDLPKLVQEAVGLACEVLITSKGECDWTNISFLKRAGFNVTPGDKDSFGWLTGVIHTKKGTINYG